MSKKRNNLLIAASGTGGHIFPALAVSKKIEKEEKNDENMYHQYKSNKNIFGKSKYVQLQQRISISDEEKIPDYYQDIPEQMIHDNMLDINDLDQFFTDIYEYYKKNGFY